MDQEDIDRLVDELFSFDADDFFLERMDIEQKEFYQGLKKHIEKGVYPDIEGQIDYVIVFLYALLDKCDTNNYEKLYDYMIHYSELYKDDIKISEACLHWSYDCLLALEKYDLFLEKTEPEEPFGTRTHFSNLRLNVQYHIGVPANPIDLVLMAGGRKSKILIENIGLYKDMLQIVFNEYSQKNGDWFTILLKKIGPGAGGYKHPLLIETPDGQPELKFDTFCFYTSAFLIDEIKLLTQKAENKVRESIGIPRIGEGWVSETQLYRFLKSYFNKTIVIQHGSPDWLRQQHFDIWFLNWNIAIEYHGKQHFEPVDFFGGEDAFEATLKRDKKKLNLSRRHGVKLFVVTEDDDNDIIAKKIEKYVLKTRKILSPAKSDP